MAEPSITLYTSSTPNGWKVSILLEELELPYKLHSISLQNLEQKQDWFLKINPNGRIPAIVDHSRNNFSVFESGAILIYLCEHYDKENKFYPKNDPDFKSKVIQWLMFQMSGIGPMQGQANHFFRYAPEQIPYAINRYQEETKRLYTILDKQLQNNEYLAGNQYTIADIATFPWVTIHSWAGVSIDNLPNLKKWHDKINERPKVKKGLSIPEPNAISKLKDPAYAEQSKLEAQKWILSGNNKK